MGDNLFQFHAMATRDDRCWLNELQSRAVNDWRPLLKAEQCALPQWLVADLGMLLTRPAATLSTGMGASRVYVNLLAYLANDASFLTCSQIILEADLQFRDHAMRTAIRNLARAAHDIEESQIVATLDVRIRARPVGSVFGAIELVETRAAANLQNGRKLVDYQLLDECLRPWSRVPEHPLRARAVPQKLLGERGVSRRAGDIAGYTAVRPRFPTDPLAAVLPSDWALVKRNRSSGVDKILNRDTLVYQRESPVDLVPRLNVLVAMLIDAGPPLSTSSATRDYRTFRLRDVHVPSAVRSKALAYRMIADAAAQVPFDVMGVDIAPYIVDFANPKCPPAKSCFDLKEIGLAEPGATVRFDDLTPFYFYYAHMQAMRTAKSSRMGRWPELSTDPFSFLNTASAAIATYTAVLTVIFSEPRRWDRVLPQRSISLRPVEFRRNTVILVEPQTAGPTRKFRWSGFENLTEAATTRDARFATGSDHEVRNCFLDMLLGPARPAATVSAARPLVVI